MTELVVRADEVLVGDWLLLADGTEQLVNRSHRTVVDLSSHWVIGTHIRDWSIDSGFPLRVRRPEPPVEVTITLTKELKTKLLNYTFSSWKLVRV